MTQIFHPPGLEAEVVLNQNSNAEEDDTLYGHRKQVLPHHVPGQRGPEAVFTCRDKYGN